MSIKVADNFNHIDPNSINCISKKSFQMLIIPYLMNIIAEYPYVEINNDPICNI